MECEAFYELSDGTEDGVMLEEKNCKFRQSQ
jgi:hypothetical protein